MLLILFKEGFNKFDWGGDIYFNKRKDLQGEVYFVFQEGKGNQFKTFLQEQENTVKIKREYLRFNGQVFTGDNIYLNEHLGNEDGGEVIEHIEGTDFFDGLLDLEIDDKYKIENVYLIDDGQ